MSDAPADRALATADARAAPAVSRPASPWVLPAGIAGVLALGAVTFFGLHKSAPPAADPVTSAGLAVSTSPPSNSASLPPPPALSPAVPAPATSLVAPTPVPIPVPPPPPAVVRETAAVPAKPASTGPALIVDLTPTDKAAVVDTPSATAAKADATGAKPTTNDAFADRVNRTAVETVTTDRLSSTDRVVPQGTIISGVLETAINSDLPGQVRAVVSRDVEGFDGTKVLVPRGSRLIGQYSSGVALGQSRAFVIWTRLLRPDGVSVQLGSAGTDELGTAGLGGKVNSHFLHRFGAATLLSVITAGLEYAVNSASAGSSVVVGSSGQANQLASVALQREIDVPPTIRVSQGTPVRVFVAKDLDFGEPKLKKP